MKSIDGKADSVVGATAEECFALLAAIQHYPEWSGELVRDVHVLEWDASGQPTSARVTLHVAQSPLVKDFVLVMSVQAKPVESVLLARVPHDASDREQLEIGWRLQREGGTRIDVSFHGVTPRVPSFVPLRGVGDEIADTLVRAAVKALDGAGG
ncbi:MAG TPA: SRPBCC family protein [Solirubrobacteraceae bacterium]